MKQPLKEMLKAIGGEHLLTENQDIADYSHELGEYIHHSRTKIKGWAFSIEINTGSWEWYHPKFEDVVYATWGWEGRNEIPVETSDGESFKTIKLKFKGFDGMDEKQLKIDAKKYIDTMKKELPKIQKKMLEY